MVSDPRQQRGCGAVCSFDLSLSKLELCALAHQIHRPCLDYYVYSLK